MLHVIQIVVNVQIPQIVNSVMVQIEIWPIVVNVQRVIMKMEEIVARAFQDAKYVVPVVIVQNVREIIETQAITVSVYKDFLKMV